MSNTGQPNQPGAEEDSREVRGPERPVRVSDGYIRAVIDSETRDIVVNKYIQTHRLERRLNTDGAPTEDTVNAQSGDLIARDKYELQLTDEQFRNILPRNYQLPELPELDELPAPGPLPTGSRIPFPRNQTFTGRQADLLALAEQLLYRHNPDQAGGLVQALTGLSGVGKTQLAAEFCHRYGRFTYGVHWISAGQDLEAEVAACGRAMGLEPWPVGVPEQARLTLLAWAHGGPRLIVLDNADELAAVDELLNDLSGLPVLITSHLVDWPADRGAHVRRLDVLNREESLALLRRLAPRLGSYSDLELEPIAEQLGDLPLAVDLVGRCLNESPGLSIEAYLEKLDEQSALAHESLRDRMEHDPIQHETSLETTFLISWAQLQESPESGMAQRIFQSCGYLAPNTSIPREIFREFLKIERQSPQTPINRAFRAVKRLGLFGQKHSQNALDPDKSLDRALRELYRLGMLNASPEGPTIHPLVGELALTQDQTAQESKLKSIAEAVGSLASQANQTGLPEEFQPLRAHVQSVVEMYEKSGLEGAGWIWNELGYHYWQAAEYVKAHIAYERALTLDKEEFGPGHPNVADRLSNLGMTLQAQGDLDGAKRAFEQALAIDEQAFGPDHTNVADRINNLGSVLWAQGDLKGARAAFERALAIDESALGPEHPNVAIQLNNLGNVLHKLGDLEGARSAYDRALDLEVATYGTEHPDVARSVKNLGLVLQDQGDLKGARAAYERALVIGERTLGTEHPEVVEWVNNLGVALLELGDLEGARKAFERALAALPPGHPRVQTARENLAKVERKLEG